MRTLSSRARKTHLWTLITCPEDLICEQREWATAIATDLPWDKAHQKIIIGQGRPIVRSIFFVIGRVSQRVKLDRILGPAQ